VAAERGQYDFETRVDRRNQGNLADHLVEDSIRRKGLGAFVAAEMDFPTAPCILEAYSARVQNGLFGFTLADHEYMSSVQGWMGSMRGWNVETDWIVPAYGIIFSLATTIRAFTSPGDGVIVQKPVYMRYEAAIERNGRRTVNNPLIYSNGRYSMDIDGLEQLMATPANRLMVLCNPHNPVGRVWTADELSAVAELAARHDVVVFSDEIFAEIVFGDRRTVPFVEARGAAPRSIVATSLGKVFNFTGVNHANMVIPDGALRDAFRIQRDIDHFGSIDPFAYTATIAGYREGAPWVRAVVDHVAGNVGLLKDTLGRVPGASLCDVEGTFVAWIDWRGVRIDDEELNRLLIEKAQLQLDPGAKYGAEGTGFTRMNLATSRSNLKAAMDRLTAAAGHLTGGARGLNRGGEN